MINDHRHHFYYYSNENILQILLLTTTWAPDMLLDIGYNENLYYFELLSGTVVFKPSYILETSSVFKIFQN